eukprot:g11087.t1
MRWTSDLFDLLLRMHEEQNRVAVRPLSLSSFYQVGGFELLGPILQKVGENLDLESGQERDIFKLYSSTCSDIQLIL